MTRLSATANHEAGHAVVGWMVRAPGRLVEASIIPDTENGTLGHVRRSRVTERTRSLIETGDVLRDVRPRLEPLILELYGGVIAERRFRGRRHNWAGASSDMNEVAGLLVHCVGSRRQADAYARFTWVMAEDVVELWHHQIARVASVLLERRTLNRAGLRAVISESFALPPSAADLSGVLAS